MKEGIEAGSELEWIHPHEDRREYLLTHGEIRLGGLSWQNSSDFLAVGDCVGNKWTFQRSDTSPSGVTVQDEADGVALGLFEPAAGGGGMLRLRDGHEFRWSSNVWSSEWVWRNMADDPMVVTRRNFAMDQREGAVRVEAGQRASRHWPMLILFGWYLIVQSAEES